MHSIAEFRIRARSRLPRVIFDFIDGGAGDESALRRNSAYFDRARFVPRAFRTCGFRSLSTTVLGTTHSFPFGIAPMGLGNLAWPGCELSLARSAAVGGIPYCLSTVASSSIERVAAAAPGAIWFQIYLGAHQAISDDLLRRAAGVGVQNLILTIDANMPARRLRDMRNRFSLPFRLTPSLAVDFSIHPAWSIASLLAGIPTMENLAPYVGDHGMTSVADFSASLGRFAVNWSAFERLRERWSGALLVKGVLHPDDAKQMLARGADGLIVSNHGGRQLSSSVCPLEVLPSIRSAVGPTALILVDGGVSTGEHIAKLIAAGADFVLIGRAFLYGVAALGASRGPAAVIDALTSELDTTMAQLGCETIAAMRSEPLHWVDPSQR